MHLMATCQVIFESHQPSAEEQRPCVSVCCNVRGVRLCESETVVLPGTDNVAYLYIQQTQQHKFILGIRKKKYSQHTLGFKSTSRSTAKSVSCRTKDTTEPAYTVILHKTVDAKKERESCDRKCFLGACFI